MLTSLCHLQIKASGRMQHHLSIACSAQVLQGARCLCRALLYLDFLWLQPLLQRGSSVPVSALQCAAAFKAAVREDPGGILDLCTARALLSLHVFCGAKCGVLPTVELGKRFAAPNLSAAHHCPPPKVGWRRAYDWKCPWVRIVLVGFRLLLNLAQQKPSNTFNSGLSLLL